MTRALPVAAAVAAGDAVVAVIDVAQLPPGACG